MTYVLTLNEVACEIDDRYLFSGLSTQFNSGDFVQIVGPNGAGKTTLLRMLTGISRRYEGEISWCGKAVPSYDFYASLLYIGHLTGVSDSLTPLENLQWYFGLNGPKALEQSSSISDKHMIDALAEVGLAGYENVISHQMSAGQQRRVALARLSLSQAPLWILDEPFTAIDKQGVARLERQLKQHCDNGGIVILTTHQALNHVDPKVVDLADYRGGRV